ncbi:MAG TPA: efflux RND transporter permease subunit [Steroidobacteraceae bacterium]|jgi:CzcA family heavy metal efflux pump|nr:efflux RND transporter permease subunit [Steroidobacteraceae bacterium]
MWIVEVALKRPYTFIVLALLLPLLGGLTLFGTPLRPGMPVDIFPDIAIPIIAVNFNYTGMSPDDMSGRITAQLERYATTIVNDIEHVESESYPGMAVIKLFFQPGVNIDLAMSQVTAYGQTALRNMPPGAQPPLILKYNASSVPILQLAMSSDKLTEAQLFDFGNQVLRSQIATIAGVSIPYPFGGATRQVQIDLRPDALRAQGLTPMDVNNTIANQSLIIPAGTEKIGATEYNVRLNASPTSIAALNDLPIRSRDGSVTYLRDVAFVHDGHPPQTNVVRVDGRRAVLMSIQKTGSASTLTIVNTIKDRLPRVRELIPDGASIAATGDQSVFVRAAIRGVVTEALIAAALTALMVLLFLGSWRSTLIIAISIPLSILSSIILLGATGETINLMTLGGLALAVGILVDDATVTIENINRHLEEGMDVTPAILEGSRQITVPALVSTLSICIVFVPMFLLTGVARYLFVPLAEAVVFAMLTSYILSRTLVPTLCMYWLRTAAAEKAALANPNAWQRFQRRFETRFEALRARYHDLLKLALANGRPFMIGFLAVAFASMIIYPFLGRNFFPEVDAGQIKLHVRGPTGFRVEDTAGLVDHVEDAVRQVIPADQISSVVDNIGLAVSSINVTYSTSGTVGSSDADVLISLKPGHAPTSKYVHILRRELPQQFPGANFAFLPADIVSQILNFGIPAPIDIQIVGPSPKNRDVANELLESVRHIPGLVDARIEEPDDLPELRVNTDRSRAQQLGITQHDVANNLLLTLSGSSQIAPSFWLNPENGLQYPLVAQTPQYRMTSLDDLRNVPVTSGATPQILGGVATITRGTTPAVVYHYDTQNLIDIYGDVQDRDLGSVADDINARIAAFDAKLPKATHIVLRGQVQTMIGSYTGLAIGVVGAILLVYLLIVINFQSWMDPFIIITALPAALAGIAWMLLITGTTLSVPALTGAIMCMGVATANSILVVSFARDRMNQGASALEAALDAGFTRFRPVLMTALAMMIGMLPMSLGMGEGGEQNAPLGRAVIGGLLLATVATLLFVPVVFTALHGRRRAPEPAHAHSPSHA